MQHKIEIPEGCKANISQENGCLIIEVEPQFKKGDILTICDDGRKCYFIPLDYNCANLKKFQYVVAYSEKCNHLTTNDFCYNSGKYPVKKATKEESELLHSKLADAGYEYNPETHKVEKIKWKPEYGEKYYTPFMDVCTWRESSFGRDRYSLGLIFKTKEESDAAAEKIKQIFAK